MSNPIFSLLDYTLGFLFHFSSNDMLNILVGVFAVSALVSTIIIFVTSKVVDQKEMKELKAKMQKLQEKFNEAKKKGDAKETNKLQTAIIENQSELMSKSMKPMLYTMPPIIVIFTWLNKYEYIKEFVAPRGYLIALPFTLPKFGDKLGWLGWYIISSFATSPLLRKIFKIET